MAINPHGDKPAWQLITNQLTTLVERICLNTAGDKGSTREFVRVVSGRTAV